MSESWKSPNKVMLLRKIRTFHVYGTEFRNKCSGNYPYSRMEIHVLGITHEFDRY